MKNFLQSVVDFLHGKKVIILAISGAILLFLGTSHLISAPLAILIQSCLTILGGGTDVATGIMGVSSNVNQGK